MKKVIFLALITFAAICPMQAQNARQLYISASGDDSNDGLSPEKPWKSFNNVLNNMMAGDIINIMPGTYSSQNTYKPLIDLKENHSGTENGYITFRAYDPDNRPKFTAGGKGVWQCVKIEASYIIFDGIEMEGNNAELDSVAADKIAYDYKYNNIRNWNDLAVYNTNGVSVGSGGTGTSFPNHVIVRNCIVHDFPGCGIVAQQSDYVTFENNIIYNNAWFTMYACSGISILNPVNSDEETSIYKNVVIGNTVYNNHTKIKWYASSNPRYSDGNGIIIDVNLSPDNSSTQEVKEDGAYRGCTLVANNVCYFNGGSGIHAFKSQNVDIFNNTAFMNEQRYNGDYGEIFSQSGKNNRIANNIMYSKSDGKCNNFSTGGATYSYNLYYNGKWTGDLWSNKLGNPLFVKEPKNPADAADFHVQEGSPAIGFGIAYSFIPSTDKEGVDRTTNTTVGAYQTVRPTGIGIIRTDRPNSTKCYDIQGRLVPPTTKGLVVFLGRKYLLK